MADERQSTHGWPRVIFAVLSIYSVVFGWTGVLASTKALSQGRVAEGLTMWIAVALWMAGSAGLVHNGRRMRLIAYAAWTTNLLAPFVALAAHSWALDPACPWYHGGATYLYIPTAGALIALLWLVWSSPAKIATRNGG